MLGEVACLTLCIRIYSSIRCFLGEQQDNTVVQCWSHHSVGLLTIWVASVIRLPAPVNGKMRLHVDLSAQVSREGAPGA